MHWKWLYKLFNICPECGCDGYPPKGHACVRCCYSDDD
jgi:hypothetical protein